MLTLSIYDVGIVEKMTESQDILSTLRKYSAKIIMLHELCKLWINLFYF